MKPWEETWYARNRTSCCTDVMVEGDTRECAFYGVVPCGDPKFPHADARARLAAAAPEAIRLLMEAEWAGAGTGGDPSQCPWCGREPWTTTERLNPERHEKTCPLVAVLRKAGVVE